VNVRIDRLIAIVAVLIAAQAAFAQYDLSWWTVDGGGGMFSTGGGFTLGGTIGQPDAAAALTGGSFSLTGGFWPGATAGPAIRRGDLNCDGTYGQGSFGDINPFVLYLSNFSAWQATYPECPPENGDLNCDGTYGQGSFGDINPFVQYLSNYSAWQATYPGCGP